jgi:REP element-mobilizing transposase RayT
MQQRFPLAYHITFTTYGTRLHGDERGTVDDRRNIVGTPYIAPDPVLRKHREALLRHEPTLLSPRMRLAANAAIIEVCEYRDWKLHALNVRSNHVHAAVSFGEADPDKVIGDFKAYATRRMRREGLVSETQRIWTAKGSRRPIWDEDGLWRVVNYIDHGQGPDLPMHERTKDVLPE